MSKHLLLRLALGGEPKTLLSQLIVSVNDRKMALKVN